MFGGFAFKFADEKKLPAHLSPAICGLFVRNTDVFIDLPQDLKCVTSLASLKNDLNSVDFSKYLKVCVFR